MFLFHSFRSNKGIGSRGSKFFQTNKKGFTLTELIVVITILSILSVIGFVVMSHQSSVARDGKRISDIKTLSESARITSAQLRKLPTPIVDSIALTVSGTFIGYQGFMSTSIVNPLGYGSDKIFDPKDNIPYTYRVNQHYDSAQFMAYLENPRFERTIEIAKQSLPSTLPSLFSQAYALDSSTTDLSSRYPYSAGDRLGIFVSKGSNQPLQNGVTGTGSRDISLSDTSTLRIIVGSSGADGYVSTDISTGSLLSLKDGSFDEKALLGMNGGTGSGGDGGSGSGGGDSGSGGGLPVSHILTMGEYSVMGNTYYGYIGPLTISLYATYGVTITTITPGSLIDDTVDGYVIDSLFWNSDYSSSITILAGSTDMPSNVAFETPYANISCTPQSSLLDITPYSCTGSTVSTDFYVGSQHDLGITIGAIPLVLPSTPTGLNGVSGDGEVNLTWDSVTDATSYTLAWEADNGGYTEITGLTGTGYLHTGLTNGATYNYKIKAVNNDGESSYSSVVSTIPDVPPEVPTNLSVSGVVANSITLSWDAIPDGQASFTIQYSTDGVNFTDVGNFSGGGGTRQYAHNGLTEGTTYYYRIRATKAYGVVSAWSDIVSAVVRTPFLMSPANITNAPINIDIISNVVTASDVSTPVYLFVSGISATNISLPIPSVEFRVNGGTWVTSAYISNGDQIEYKTQINHYNASMAISINFGGQISSWNITSSYGPPSLPMPLNITNAPLGTDVISNVVTASNISNSVPITVSGAEFRVNGGSWVTSANISNGDQVEYKTQVAQTEERKVVEINFNGNSSQWIVDAYSCFSFSNGTITNYSNSCTKDVVIPSKIWNQDVTSIGNVAFSSKFLTSVTMPDSILAIGNSAFVGNQLTSVTIPENVIAIGDYAFAGNPDAPLIFNHLTSIVIPNSVITIGDGAFAHNQLTSVTLGNSVTFIGGYNWLSVGAFGNNKLTSVTIPESVTTIGASAFYGNQLTSIDIPGNVTTIGYAAFAGGNHITSVILPDGITGIGDYAFQGNGLTSIVIPDSVVILSGFGGNQITSVTIPNSVTSIGHHAFSSNQLTSVVIPNSVTSIIAYAFSANQITSVTIPNSVTYIDTGAFGSNQISSVVIPDSVTYMGDEVFYGNQLSSVLIGNSVTRIGDDAFRANQLTSVMIPDSVTSIGENAFHSNQLTSVTLGDSITSIGNYAFAYNNLTSITIPNSVTSIGDGAFSSNQLTSVTMGNSIVSILYAAFNNQSNSPGNGTVYGPSSGYVKNTYINNTNIAFDKVKLPNYVDLP